MPRSLVLIATLCAVATAWGESAPACPDADFAEAVLDAEGGGIGSFGRGCSVGPQGRGGLETMPCHTHANVATGPCRLTETQHCWFAWRTGGRCSGDLLERCDGATARYLDFARCARESRRAGSETVCVAGQYRPEANEARDESTWPRVPLGVMQWGGGWRFSVSVSFPTTSGGISPRTLLLDSGSSTVALCDDAEHTLTSTIRATPQGTVSCNEYGSAEQGSGYNGQFFFGNMTVGSDAGIAMAGYYARMKFHANMPCDSGFQGIFGIAFKGLDEYYDAGDADGYESQTTYASAQEWCKEAQDEGWDGRYSDPLLGTLLADYGSGDRIFGIHYNGVLSESAGEGALYMGPSARKTSLYDPRDAQVADLYDATFQDHRQLLGFYSVKVAGVKWNDRTYLFGSQGAASYAQGILDTGTPILEVPQSILDSMYSDLAAAQDGTLSIVLESGAIVVIGSGQELLGTDANQLLQAQASSSVVMLGFPLWMNNYVVMDISNEKVEFSSTIPPACRACPVGRFSAGPGASECGACDSGRYQNVTGSASCLECPSGKYSHEAASHCDSCADGGHECVVQSPECGFLQYAVEGRPNVCRSCYDGGALADHMGHCWGAIVLVVVPSIAMILAAVLLCVFRERVASAARRCSARCAANLPDQGFDV